jgi:hypothetical protein
MFEDLLKNLKIVTHGANLANARALLAETGEHLGDRLKVLALDLEGKAKVVVKNLETGLWSEVQEVVTEVHHEVEVVTDFFHPHAKEHPPAVVEPAPEPELPLTEPAKKGE